MSNIVELECVCGGVKGNISVQPGSFFHVHCLCVDCQQFASHLNSEARIVDDHGASELLQTYPCLMKITEGHDKIGCLQLSHKGLYRWHTTCCNMPLANTMRSSKVPFIGVSVTLMKFSTEQEKEEVLGPVVIKAFGKYSRGKMPQDAHASFPVSYLYKIIAFMVKGVLGKKSRPSPFFKGKKPVAMAKVLS